MSKHFNEAVEGDDGGLVICRGCKAKGTYAALPSGECPKTYKPDSVLLKESLAREQALQQRLTAADELVCERTASLLECGARRKALERRADVLEGLLRKAKFAVDDVAENCEDQADWADAGSMRGLSQRIDAALKPAVGSTCNQIREDTGLPINNPCHACNNGSCIDK